MASIVSKLAAVASRTSLAAVGGTAGGRRPISPCHPPLYLTGDAIRRMCSGVSPEGKPEEENVGPKSEGENGDPKSSEENRCPKPGDPDYVNWPENAISELASKDPYLSVVDGKLIESKEAIYELYEYWCKYHGISRERAEMRFRFKTFKSNAKYVHKVNNSGGGCKLALLRYADMAENEFLNPRPRPYYYN